MLGGIGIHSLTLDITHIGHGQHALLLGDQILDVHLAGDDGDLGAALVTVLVAHLQALVLHDGLDLHLVGQNALVLGNLHQQRAQLVLNLLALQTAQLTEAHLNNSVRLHVVKGKALH